MNEQTLTDTQIKAAFLARSEGSISHDLADRIHAETSRTRQASRLTVLPGGLAENPNVGRLLWAAAISATSLALVGGLLLAGGQPDDHAVVPPIETPTPSPVVYTPEPSEAPSESPAPQPTPSVEPSPTPIAVFDPRIGVDGGAVTLVGDLRVRSLPTVDESSQKLEPLLPAGARLLVIEEPVVADGYAWYHVVPFDGAYPSGWVAAGSREGEAWIAADDLSCPETPLQATQLIELGVYGGLACYGNDTIDVTGEVQCSQGDLDQTIGGPTWLSSDASCQFMVDGAPAYFFYPDAGVEVTYPYDFPIVQVTGHFADAQSASCEWGVDPPAPEQHEVEAMCRAIFVVTEMEVQPIDVEG